MCLWEKFEDLTLEFLERRVAETGRCDVAESHRERAGNGGLGGRAGGCTISGGEWCAKTGKDGAKSLNPG